MPMALRDKLNSLAAEAASKANTAIENGKLSLKINNEEKKIDEFTLNIGELVLDKLDGGETFDDEIMALYSSIQAAREVIARREPTLRPAVKGKRQKRMPFPLPVPAVVRHCPRRTTFAHTAASKSRKPPLLSVPPAVRCSLLRLCSAPSAAASWRPLPVQRRTEQSKTDPIFVRPAASSGRGGSLFSRRKEASHGQIPKAAPGTDPGFALSHLPPGP